MKREKIVCAAIKTVGTNGESKRSLISIGVDYHFIQEQEGYEGFYDTETVLTEIRGFITNKNRFVDPREAMAIAINAKQIPYLNDLFESYERARITSPGVGVCYEAKMLFDGWEHQRKNFDCRGLKPEDLY